MSITNLGDQYITFDYHHPAQAKEFNTLLREAINPGVYSGGTITYAGTQATIAPFVAYIKTDEVSSNKLVRVETRSATTISVNASTPVIALTYTWDDVSENWLDFNQRASGSSALPYEVCLGECVFTLGAITSVTYANKTWGRQTTNDVPVGTTPFYVTSTTRVDNLNADMLDDKHFQDIVNALYPVGSFYVQYPDAASSVDATAFPTASRPATLFGGTWVEQFNTENVFFRTAGTDYQTRTTGLSADQFQAWQLGASADTTGARNYWIDVYTRDQGYTLGGAANNAPVLANISFQGNTNMAKAMNDGTNGNPRMGLVTEPRNRLMKLWKRTVL